MMIVMLNNARSTAFAAVPVLAALAAIAAFFFLPVRTQGEIQTHRGEAAPEADPAIAQSRPPSAGGKLQLLSVLFPRTETHDFETPAPGTYKLPVIKPASDGKVLDQSGRPTTLARQFRGKIALLSFIYTRCSDTHGCPLATGLLFDVFHASAVSPALARNTKLIIISFDPIRDDPDAMKSYGQNALEDEDRDEKMGWSFLTTASHEELNPILEAYGQAVSIASDSNTLKHVLRLYLIDRKGSVRNVYGLGFLDPRLLLVDIETLLMEEANKKGS